MSNNLYSISTFITLVIVSYFGVRSSKNIKNSSDFAVGGRNFSSSQVASSIIGTLVGGASTIGTAQAAFVSGFNGIWFTLGASIGCLFLGAFLSKPLRNSNVNTIPQFMVTYYGEKSRIISSSISSIAIFVHITGQILSAVAIITSLFYISENAAVIITMLLIISYIFFGGFLGSSIVGSLKTILLYVTLSISIFIVLKEFNGVKGIVNTFPKNPWFNIFSEGILTGLASGFSLVVGVCSTQTYLQAIFSGKNYKASRKGAFISALLIPPIGLVCTLIGMFMRANYPDIVSKQALPLFVTNHLNPVIGGIMIATLIISVVATGAGLTLGISTMISKDIYKGFINKNADDKKQLFVLRISILIISLFATIIVFLNMDSLILKWAFLSMTLRGTVIFMPLIFALLLKNKTPKKAGLISMITSPILTVFLSIIDVINIDPLYIGISISLIIFLIGYNIKK